MMVWETSLWLKNIALVCLFVLLEMIPQTLFKKVVNRLNAEQKFKPIK